MSDRLSNMRSLYPYILEQMQPHQHIIAGSFINDDTDVNFQEFINGTNVVGQRLRYVAVRGQIDDWAIYVDRENKPDKMIVDNGVKVRDHEVVEKLVNCGEGILSHYRR